MTQNKLSAGYSKKSSSLQQNKAVIDHQEQCKILSAEEAGNGSLATAQQICCTKLTQPCNTLLAKAA